ncbi:MAG TPA: RNA polymerase sigma-54 factor, partial [Burkholderiaceae bacterium]|nr:RNA polymerase sigma-54 factor [Burkholderiaceae bacterium]
TILRVSQAIMTHQQDYLDHGPAHMRPLVLRDIAVALGIHESTVSRATRYKYAQTPHGVIELRAFFGSTLETADGESTSASAVQFMIARLIGDEPRSKPLSDNKISQLLEQQGIKVARRTVAKYREAAGIEPAIRRKARYAMQL